MTEFDPVRDPGPRDPRPQLAEIESRRRRRVKRQIAGMVAVAAVLVLVSVVFYFAFRVAAGEGGVNLGDLQVHNLGFGLTLGLALLLLGGGMVSWSRSLTNSTEIVERRKASGAVEPGAEGIDRVAKRGGLGRRRLIRSSLLGALVLLPLPAIVALRGLDPAQAAKRRHTVWAEGVRLLTDPTHKPIRASDLQVGELVNVMPASFLELPEDGPARSNERAKAPVALVRMRPDEITAAKGRENWHVDGIVAYSKICTHLGCPVSLYERRTHHVVCPCHQATFDLADNGAVVFGPATRSLPQLPLAVDDDGYLVAQSDFTEPVGPGYWERET